MLQPFYTRQFKKDLKKIEKSGRHDIERIKTVIRLLIEEKPLGRTYRDHTLTGDFKDRRECHIEPDWLLIYKINRKERIIIFERTGSHSDIFG
ncbi:MAG: type II toxin-antitoxin system mRNA interferase toxin, RelE/StbE family [Nitrospirae bacterium CG_4_9_14_3_um_filter_41_27]|nr:MAG: damage-inducible protein [Nitrospirae bacterium CG2_30_41_42]PIV43516.1 MAG: type II toxin-antitoxin system mRNA interferase toxin, RelE/StbE family [Nitrospirae bacterium CG02_land_8_20_14_3_00_41_53]PJA79126.1 MAG: type II toxin-antitoxin system mRNA interferase toxin, RelE/StbE family [Nitrospirae bacterium CG_4_9_14_3_um_filter_41_27]